jgi:hypothetical protein
MGGYCVGLSGPYGGKRAFGGGLYGWYETLCDPKYIPWTPKLIGRDSLGGLYCWYWPPCDPGCPPGPLNLVSPGEGMDTGLVGLVGLDCWYGPPCDPSSTPEAPKLGGLDGGLDVLYFWCRPTCDPEGTLEPVGVGAGCETLPAESSLLKTPGFFGGGVKLGCSCCSSRLCCAAVEQSAGWIWGMVLPPAVVKTGGGLIPGSIFWGWVCWDTGFVPGGFGGLVLGASESNFGGFATFFEGLV